MHVAHACNQLSRGCSAVFLCERVPSSWGGNSHCCLLQFAHPIMGTGMSRWHRCLWDQWTQLSLEHSLCFAVSSVTWLRPCLLLVALLWRQLPSSSGATKAAAAAAVSGGRSSHQLALQRQHLSPQQQVDLIYRFRGAMRCLRPGRKPDSSSRSMCATWCSGEPRVCRNSYFKLKKQFRHPGGYQKQQKSAAVLLYFGSTL